MGTKRRVHWVGGGRVHWVLGESSLGTGGEFTGYWGSVHWVLGEEFTLDRHFFYFQMWVVYQSKYIAFILKIIIKKPVFLHLSYIVFTFRKVCNSLQKLQDHNFCASHLFLYRFFPSIYQSLILFFLYIESNNFTKLEISSLYFEVRSTFYGSNETEFLSG